MNRANQVLAVTTHRDGTRDRRAAVTVADDAVAGNIADRDERSLLPSG
jgi:hypothetical protein